jgi:hypothetical protein
MRSRVWAIRLRFLSPLGERLGEGGARAVSCITPSPNLSPKGERSLSRSRSRKGA